MTSARELPSVSPAGQQTTAHYLEMDFLRGIAATVVVLYHIGDRTDLPLLFAHGYLCVDFFFTLSGFVLAHAYGQKLAARQMGLGNFLLMRLIRLLPMVVLGTTIGGIFEIAHPAADVTTHLFDIVVAWIKGCLLIPTLQPTTLEYLIFPLNGPVWSLFFEIIANVVFAAALLLGSLRPVGVMAVIAGFLGLAWFETGNVSLGSAGAVGDLFGYGLARVALSFFIGLGLYRVRQYAIFAINRWVLAVVLAAACFTPRLPQYWSGIFDGIVIIVIFPAIVFVASSYKHNHSISKIAVFAGTISYPLYAIHYTFVRVFGFISQHHPLSLPIRLMAVLYFTFAMIGIAAFCNRYYDGPIRQWLRTMSTGGTRLLVGRESSHRN